MLDELDELISPIDVYFHCFRNHVDAQPSLRHPGQPMFREAADQRTEDGSVYRSFVIVVTARPDWIEKRRFVWRWSTQLESVLTWDTTYHNINSSSSCPFVLFVSTREATNSRWGLRSGVTRPVTEWALHSVYSLRLGFRSSRHSRNPKKWIPLKGERQRSCVNFSYPLQTPYLCAGSPLWLLGQL